MKLQGQMKKTLAERPENASQTRRLIWWGVFFSLIFIWAPSSLAAKLLPTSWLATEKTDHPLVGQLWSVKRQAAVPLAAWLDEQPSGQWILLGEQHDHPDHQVIAALWVKALADRQDGVLLALEMAEAAQQEQLDAALGQMGPLPEDLGWNSGWRWSTYAELVQTGLLVAERVLGVDLSRADKRAAYQQGAEQPALSIAMAEALDALIHQGHCELLPPQQLPSMRQVQLARDQAMARYLNEENLNDRRGLLLAGSVHVRRDLGIPRWLPASQPSVSVLLRQVDERTDWADYLPAAVEGIEAFDYVLFTPAIPEVDYCAELEAQMSGH